MKKIVIAILAVFCLSIVSFSDNKEKTYTFSEQQLNNIWRQTGEVQIYLDNSNLPHAEVKFINNKLDSVKMVILAEYRTVNADTTKKEEKPKVKDKN